MDKNHKLFLGATLASLLLFGAVLALVINVFTNVPDFREMRNKVKVTIFHPDGSKATRWVGPKAADWVPIRQISSYLLSAIISSEDTTFYIHKGVDFYELKQAVKKDLEEKRWARGASTLTQQVVKNVYLSRQKTLWRKLKEFLWAQAIEKVLSKSEILCFYANMVEWGPDVYGVRAAARHYFGETPSELTPRQAAFLAMLLPSPLRYHSYFARRKLSHWATARVDRILTVMHGMGFIDDDEYRRGFTDQLWGEVARSGEQMNNPALLSDVPPEAPGDDEVPDLTVNGRAAGDAAGELSNVGDADTSPPPAAAKAPGTSTTTNDDDDSTPVLGGEPLKPVEIPPPPPSQTDSP